VQQEQIRPTGGAPVTRPGRDCNVLASGRLSANVRTVLVSDRRRGQHFFCTDHPTATSTILSAPLPLPGHSISGTVRTAHYRAPTFRTSTTSPVTPPTDLVDCLESTTTLEPVALMRWLDNSGLARGPFARLRPPRSTLVCCSLRRDHGPLARAGWRRVAWHTRPEVCAGCRSQSWGSSTPWPTQYFCLGK